jgi:hypothetical protein
LRDRLKLATDGIAVKPRANVDKTVPNPEPKRREAALPRGEGELSYEKAQSTPSASTTTCVLTRNTTSAHNKMRSLIGQASAAW